MADPVNTPVGASSFNPNPATPQAESEQTNNPSAAQPSGAGAAPTTNPSSEPASASDAISVFTAGMNPLITQLNASLQQITPADAKRHASVGAKRQQVIAMVVAMLGKHPTLSGTTPDDMSDVSDDVDACKTLSDALKVLTATVDSTGRLRLEANWRVASSVLGSARKLAPQDLAINQDVVAIDAVLATGPRAETAAHSLVTAQVKADKADARAAAAHAKLAVKTAAANALQHGTGDATITQPAPSAPAPSTTAPSASALAATPGTPGSTTIR